MALKDWKKTEEDKYTTNWVNKNTQREVRVSLHDEPNDKKVPYYVRIENRNKTTTFKWVKTKSKALAYARIYMRKH